VLRAVGRQIRAVVDRVLSGELLADAVVERLELSRIGGVEVESAGIAGDLFQIGFVEFRSGVVRINYLCSPSKTQLPPPSFP
jgi:hypothetical protein